jgi:hypothetical protein
LNSKSLPWLVVAAGFLVNGLAGVTRNLLAVVMPAGQPPLVAHTAPVRLIDDFCFLLRSLEERAPLDLA